MFASPIFTSTYSEWPLQEYEEKRILNALSLQQQQSNSSWSEDDVEQELLSPLSSTSSTSYFTTTDKAPFQLTNQRRQSLTNSLRCPLCQRRFHSQGNLSNHTQLYH